MLKNKQGKHSKVLKTMVFGTASLLSLAFFPFNAVQVLTVSGATGNLPSNTISVSGADKSVVKGEEYKIAEAKYKGSKEIVVGAVDADIQSKVVVTYKNSNKTYAVTAGKFIPDMVGTYVVSYSVKDNGKTYSYDLEFECTVAEVNFEFKDNQENILPSIYDMSMFKSGEEKDIVLPTPVLKKGDDEISIPVDITKPADKSDAIVITVNGGANGGAVLVKENGKIVLKGTEIAKAGVGTYTFTYTLYQNGQFVTSTSKSVDVKTSYYKTKAENGNVGYDLTVPAKDAFTSTVPTSASTGVEVKLPTVSATTSASNSPASEKINISYAIKVFTGDNYNKDVSSDINFEDMTFMPKTDGNYKFVYTIKDFYGHEVSNESLTFYIKKVKDDKAPTVYMYNGADTIGFDEDGNRDYVSAKNILKSNASMQNLIIYAIGANDNVTDKGLNANKDMNLTRRIDDVSGITKITINEYSKYNLIFNFNGNYTELMNNNYALKAAMTKADRVSNDTIKAWLIANNYLIVTNNYITGTFDKTTINFFEGRTDVITDKNDPNFSLDKVKTELIKDGFAYVDYNYTFTNQNYKIYYIAKDVAGNTTEGEYYTINTTTDADYSDIVEPVITFSSSLQTTYLPKDVIKFDAAKVSDTQDKNLGITTAYRYLDVNGNGITTVPDLTTKTLSFELFNSDNKGTKWYNSKLSNEGDGVNTGDGFIILDETKSNYEIDLAKAPVGASKVEILVYAVDDNGNFGFFNKIVSIANQNDTTAPELLHADEPANTNVKQGEKITLPTITYADDYVDYMTSEVLVYHVDTNGAKLMTSANSVPTADSYRGIYTLYAGDFTASYSGDYVVKVVSVDAGNNSIVSFFNYIVTGNTIVEDPIIDNISSETVSLSVGDERYLPSPTLSITPTSGYSYIGYEEADDAKTASYYTISMVSAETNYYNLNKNNFSAAAAGKYEISYKVYLIKYLNSAADLRVENGKLIANVGNTDYYIYVDMNKLNTENKPLLVGCTTLTGYNQGGVDAEFLNAAQLAALDVSVYSPAAQTQKFMVTDDVKPLINVDTTEYKTYSSIGEIITIQRIAATENSKLGIDPAKSYVEITISKASGSVSTEKIYMNKWEEKTDSTNRIFFDGTDLKLKLNENGNYSITYAAVDYSGNTGTAKYSFANGDTQKPEVKVNDGFLNHDKDKYDLKANNELILDINKLELSDNITDITDLKDSITFKVENIDTQKTITAVEGTKNTFKLTTAGEYKITITVTDTAGWKTEKTVNLTVNADANNPLITYKVIGTILIVLSVVILLGVVGYFIYSKVKLDKETKKVKKSKKKKS